MFQLYKDLKIAYYAIALSVAIPLAAYGGWEEKVGPIVWALIMPFIIAIVIESIAIKRFNALNKIREVNCNIAEYRSELEKLRINCKNAKTLYTVNMNLIAALLDMGSYQEALNLLHGINPQLLGKGSVGVNNRGAYFNNLACAYICLGDLESAERVLLDMKQCIDDPKIKNLAKEKNLLFDLYTMKKILIQIEKGNLEGAEQILLMMMEKAKSNLWQVSTSYNLAKVYLQKGNAEQAKRYIDFVMKYGGDTVYKSEISKMI
ncbi:MAG: hypothetical protein IJD45_02665 [Clostridia bacterium]|nr:hypothetical protein [Clostridia bacterium]